MTAVSRVPAAGLTGFELENALACIEKGQQLGGHFPDATDIEYARKILIGEMTLDEVCDAIAAEFGYTRTQ